MVNSVKCNSALHLDVVWDTSSPRMTKQSEVIVSVERINEVDDQNDV